MSFVHVDVFNEETARDRRDRWEQTGNQVVTMGQELEVREHAIRRLAAVLLVELSSLRHVKSLFLRDDRVAAIEDALRSVGALP